jgi:halogenation protein CepH
LVGDAACFVDPVFSSGVHLATYSALLAARSINTCLRHGVAVEADCFQEFERRYRREYGNFYQFCSAFYDMEQTTESYFWAARKILNTDEPANEAFVRLVAGLSQGGEPSFSSAEYFEARAGLGTWLADMMAKSHLAEGARRPEQSVPQFDKTKFDPALFMQGFTSEITQLQLLAMYGKDRPTDEPVVPNGLVPSTDGLHWALTGAGPVA